MSKLPKISYPIHNATLPSNDKPVQFRPFTTKEEKILLIAKESKDLGQIITSLKQILNNCLIKYNVDDLAIVDIEYMFMQIRSNSVNNEVEFQIVDTETNEPIKIAVDLKNITVKKSDEHSDIIKVDDNTSIQMRYPSWDELEMIMREGFTKEKTLFKMMINCIHAVITGDEVVLLSDCTEDDVLEFVESLTGETLEGIKKFFETQPVLRHEIPYTNSKGNEHIFVIEGMQTFFI